jgi:hypothetical protein
MILPVVTGSLEPPELTVSLIRDILLAYGEEEMSEDQGLLREKMLEIAGAEGEKLEASAFARALTRGVFLYDAKNEVALNTNYRDVMKIQKRSLTRQIHSCLLLTSLLLTKST